MQQEIERIIARHSRLKSERLNWETHWQEALELCKPRSATVTVKTSQGDKRMTKVYDGTAINALDILAAGMNTFLTSQTTRWFQLETEEADLLQYDEVVEWLQDTEKRLYRMLRQSNFYSSISESYLDDGSIGTSIMYVEEDFEDTCRFYTRHISECCIAENNKGRVDTLFREFPYTARQAMQEWGDACSQDVKKAVEKEPDKEFTFLHVVMPREDRDPRKSDKLSMPFASIYLEPKPKVILAESGYQEFPYMAHRWTKDTGETYGRSPAMNALADTKMVNEMAKTNIKAGQKAVDPPLIAPDDGVIGSVKLTPGGITYIRADLFDRNAEPRPMKLGGNTRIGLEMEDRRREAIRKFFFVDLFLLLMERPTMTATEVTARNEEKAAILGPTLGRIMSEKLNPIIKRSFGIMARRNKFRPAPEILRKQKLMIRYVSLLAKVQELYETRNIQNTLAEISPYAGVFPEVWDNVEPDMLFDEIADRHGFPQRARRGADKIAKIRQARVDVAREETEKQDLIAGADALGQAKKAGLMDNAPR